MKTTRHTLSLSGSNAFTLVELLVSLAVLSILLLINAQVIGQVQSTWSASNARVSQFREARTAFDIITRNLSQATLNTYLDYETNYLATAAATAGTAAATGPGSYVRRSDLQFICGDSTTLLPGAGGADSLPGHAIFFQAPLGVTQNPNYVGLDRLLCSRGYFVQFSSDAFFTPAFLPQGNDRYRYRLMEYSPPAEKNVIYTLPTGVDGTITGKFYSDAGAPLEADETALNVSTTRPVADNILMLIISPRRETKVSEVEGANGPTEIAPDYQYNSSATGATQNLLPPLVRVVLVAIDEKSAERLAETSGSPNTPPFGASLNTPFTQAYQLDDEIKELVATLQAQRVNYRVFSATVQLRGAKWGI